jgi:histidine triad (HIT) family protein
MTDCIFCKIVARSLPSHIVYEDAQVLAFLDLFPIRPGHTLIVPKVHYDTFEDLPSELMARIGKVAQTFARHMKAIYNPLRVGMVISGTDVPHMHAHVCPMLEKYDITSARYITSPNPIFAMPPRADAVELAREAARLRDALAMR